MSSQHNQEDSGERMVKLPPFFTRRSSLWTVALLGAVLCGAANLPWQLEEFSQDRQALASFQMVKEGRWLYQQAPRSRTERSATKPPLIAWISAGIYGLTRSWRLAWRLPSAAATILLALAVYRSARRAFDSAAALIGLSALLFNMLTPRLATLVRTDMPLALVVFAIGVTIWERVRTGTAWTARDRFLIFVLLTIGNYIKGPVVYLFILPGVLLYEILRRNRGGTSAWCGWWPWLASLTAFLPWVIGGVMTQPGFYDQVIMHEFLGRFSSAEQAPHPPYFYLAHLLRKFAPWFELLILLAGVAAAEARWAPRKIMAQGSASDRWLWCWLLGALVLMSLVPSKRIDRIYPLVPPMCLIIAAQSIRIDRRQVHYISIAFAFSILFTLHYVGYKRVYLGYTNHRDALARFGQSVREVATANHWRYEAIVSHDGAILLYLRKTQFLELEDAVSKWNKGELDAIVAEDDKAAALLSSCPRSRLGELTGTEKSDERGRKYVVVVRE